MTKQPADIRSANSQPGQSFWSRPIVKWTITLLLGALFVLAFLTYLATDLVSNQLLDPQLYTNALEKNLIYNRVYTDLLADPDMEEKAAQLLGNVGLEDLADSVYSLAVSTLYLVLPPDTIQTATEGVIVEVTSYLKGETDQLEPRLDLASDLDEEALTERITALLQVLITELIIQSLPSGEATGSDPDIEALADYAQALSRGELPDIPASALASSLEGLSEAEREEVVDALLGPVEGEISPLMRLRVEAAVAANDMPSALAIASRFLLQDQVSEAAAQLADEFANGETYNALAATAIYLEETEEDVFDRLDAVRDFVSVLDRRLIPLAILVMAITLALIVWIHGDSIVEVLRSAGVTFLVAGGLAVLLWIAVRGYLRAWLPELFEGSQATIPASLETMIRDVAASLTIDLWSSVWIMALVVAIGGIILIAISYIRGIVGLIQRLLGPVWPYRRAILAGLAVLFVVVPFVGRMLFGAFREEAQPCNGHVELCDRPFNEVTLAGTHNGMSIADYGWLWPSHDGSITFQLNSGIRALLIDTHYYDAKASLSSYLADAAPEVVAVAEKAVDAVGLETKQGTYLCHLLCHLGSTPLAETLEEVRLFLESHPREVVVIIIEDKISIEDTEATFEASGLMPYIYTHQEGQPWPTLGEMIDGGQRLVVMAEVEGPPPAWYHHAWDYTEETPYSFEDPTQFSCQPNRGDTGKPFFLLNHWIERVSPSRVDAAHINDYEFLLDRARQCAEERGQIPNFVAVNFYLAGDVLAVVDELNGVRDSSQTVE